MRLAFCRNMNGSDINGYSENEMNYFKKLIRDNAHLIMEFSQEGGFSDAANL